MADKIEIEVEIAADGTVRLTTHGLKGDSCVTETQSIAKAVGKEKQREKTREAFEKAGVAQTVKRK